MINFVVDLVCVCELNWGNLKSSEIVEIDGGEKELRWAIGLRKQQDLTALNSFEYKSWGMRGF